MIFCLITLNINHGTLIVYQNRSTWSLLWKLRKKRLYEIKRMVMNYIFRFLIYLCVVIHKWRELFNRRIYALFFRLIDWKSSFLFLFSIIYLLIVLHIFYIFILFPISSTLWPFFFYNIIMDFHFLFRKFLLVLLQFTFIDQNGFVYFFISNILELFFLNFPLNPDLIS